MNTVQSGRLPDLLALVDRVRRLAFGSLPPVEALGRIRDEFRTWDDDGEVEP